MYCQASLAFASSQAVYSLEHPSPLLTSLRSRDDAAPREIGFDGCHPYEILIAPQIKSGSLVLHISLVSCFCSHLLSWCCSGTRGTGARIDDTIDGQCLV